MPDPMTIGLAVNEAIRLVEEDEIRPDWARSILEPLSVDEELEFAEILRDLPSTYASGRKTTYWNIFKRHLEFYE